MAVTPNLGLTLEASLTPTARRNLLKIDSLGATFALDSQQNLVLRSKSNIILLPNEASSGGSGSGGTIQFGTAAQPLTNLSINASAFTTSSLTLSDAATASTGSLKLTYKSDAEGSLDNVARTLSIDVGGGNRTLSLSSNLLVSGGEVRLAGPADVTLPASGTLVNQNSAETLTNKLFDAMRLLSGSFTQIIAPGNPSSNITWVLPDAAGTSGQVLTKSTGNTLVWASPVSGEGNEASYTWVPADGSSLTINHSLNSQKILIQILDTANNYANIEVDGVTRPNANAVQLTSNSVPPNDWLVLLKGVI